MAGNGKAPVLVVVQLTGGNDFMNTIIPYTHGVYHDSRPTVGIPEEYVLPLNDTLAFHPRTAPLKELYDMGKVAIIQGIGYPNSNRSHFRGMDIWHTCEPHRIVTEGWLGKTIHELDPHLENVLTGVSFGRGLPRAMVKAGVPVTSVGNLDNYGMMTGIEQAQERFATLEIFKDMYAPAIGTGAVMDYLSQTGLDVLKGADIIKKAPETYTSSVEYPDNPIAKSLRDVARVHFANLGTRIFYTQHGGYDTHANEVPTHPRLVDELSSALRAFMQDLWEHEAANEVVILVFTEFGRRIKDNGSGTDHGSGGGAFLIGERVVGGLYSEYPSLDPAEQLYGEDLKHTFDFRGVYATLLEQWLGVEAAPIVGGTYEQLQPFQG
jgi:uncharacterized protein (DUF1501 family)